MNIEKTKEHSEHQKSEQFKKIIMPSLLLAICLLPVTYLGRILLDGPGSDPGAWLLAAVVAFFSSFFILPLFLIALNDFINALMYRKRMELKAKRPGIYLVDRVIYWTVGILLLMPLGYGIWLLIKLL
jgi:hypothetical protein